MSRCKNIHELMEAMYLAFIDAFKGKWNCVVVKAGGKFGSYRAEKSNVSHLILNTKEISCVLW